MTSTSLTKTEVKDGNDQTVYILYALPETISYTKWTGEGKLLVENIEKEIPSINNQTRALFEKKIEITKHFQNKFEELTRSYEEKLKQTQENIKEKLKQIQKLQNQLAQTEKVKNESKKLNEELINDLELANEQISQLKINSTQNQVEVIEDNDLEIIRQRKIKLASEAKNFSNSVDKTLAINSNPFYATTNSSAIQIEMRTSLPIFTGRPDANPNISDWIFQSKKIMDLANYTESQMVAIGTNHLKELAQQDYILYEKTNGIHKTWSEFSEFMIKRYTPANQNQLIRTKIKYLYQITSIQDYYNEFRKLVLQATDMNEAEKLNAFINGMKPGIRKYVRMQLPKSMESAYEAANLYETYNCENVDATYISNQVSNQKNSNNQKNYSIIFVQRVGNSYRFEIKYNDGTTKWVPETMIDSDMKENFLNSKDNPYNNNVDNENCDEEDIEYHNQTHNYYDQDNDYYNYINYENSNYDKDNYDHNNSDNEDYDNDNSDYNN